MGLVKYYLIIFMLSGLFVSGFTQEEGAKVYEEDIEMTTYPFGDPDPVANIGRIYPYFKFDGYTARGRKQAWKFIILENKYIKVYITPEIGGKVWGAIEKGSGRDFIYFNKVVKFRNIAMRGPWTSGGIEFNFGAIGHAPSCSTPVDYVYQQQADGSVSCTVGAMDLASRTSWRVTIRLPRDKAYFESHCFWTNATPFNQSFYHWMNAAAEVSEDLQYIFPGSQYLSHGGQASVWPVNRQGVDLSRYGNNTFGPHKSYHVMGTYDHFFAGYWQNRDFGFGHWSLHGDKPGKKIWLWALSRQGEIWKDLLTDKENKQYTEIQSGAMYTQAAQNSSFTPFKHAYFSPNSHYQSRELWFPIKDTGGVSAVSPVGALSIREQEGHVLINICPLQALNEELVVKEAGSVILRKQLRLKPMQAARIKVPGIRNLAVLGVNLGQGKLAYSAAEKERHTLQRPLVKPAQYNWESAEGLFMTGEERARLRDFIGALAALKKCLTKEPFHVRALSRLGELYYRHGLRDKALQYLKKALSVNTYDAQANFYYGLVKQDLGKNFAALAALGWAARSLEFRSAAYNRMAMISLKMGKFGMADSYGQRSLDFNRFSLSSLQLLAVSARLQQKKERAETLLNKIREIDPLSHFRRIETYLWQISDQNKRALLKGIKNEFPEQTLLELALLYSGTGQHQTAIKVLNLAPAKPLIHLWLAYLYRQTDLQQSDQHLLLVHKKSIRMVFPFRRETLGALDWAINKASHWKLKYYQALIFWNNGRLSDAAQRLYECGSLPNEYPFYLARGRMLSQMENTPSTASAANYKRALAMAPQDWRCWHYLGQHYLKSSQPKRALAVLRKALPRFKSSYIIRLDLAGALLANGRYQKCINLLQRTRVLPYEGAREGRHLFYQANILLALQKLNQKNLTKVFNLCQQARLWPENLGVGKPYVTDERMEDFITAMVYQKKGDSKIADQHYQQVINHTKNQFQQSSAFHYLAVLALKQLDRPQEARELLKSWHGKFPGDKIVQWCQARFEGKHLVPPKITPPSREFSLLLELLK